MSLQFYLQVDGPSKDVVPHAWKLRRRASVKMERSLNTRLIAEGLDDLFHDSQAVEGVTFVPPAEDEVIPSLDDLEVPEVVFKPKPHSLGDDGLCITCQTRYCVMDVGPEDDLQYPIFPDWF